MAITTRQRNNRRPVPRVVTHVQARERVWRAEESALGRSGAAASHRSRTRRQGTPPHAEALTCSPRHLVAASLQSWRKAQSSPPASVRGSPSKRKPAGARREGGDEVPVPCRFPGWRRETQCRAACAPIRARATALRAVQPGAATRASCGGGCYGSGRGCYGLEGAPMLGRFGRRCVEARAPRALTLDTRLPAPSKACIGVIALARWSRLWGEGTRPPTSKVGGAPMLGRLGRRLLGKTDIEDLVCGRKGHGARRCRDSLRASRARRRRHRGVDAAAMPI